MNATPGGWSALLRPRHACRSPPLTLSPKPAVPVEKKGFDHPFSAGKRPLENSAQENRTRALLDLMAHHEDFFVPKIKNMEVV